MFRKFRNKINIKIVSLIINHEFKKHNVMKNYRTTIIAFAGAIFYACLPIIQNGNFNWQRDWHNLASAAIIAAFGVVAKDAKVTGLPTDPNIWVSGKVYASGDIIVKNGQSYTCKNPNSDVSFIPDNWILKQ